MKTVSALHPPSRMFLSLGVESGLLSFLLTICVCSQTVEEVQGMIIHDQNPSKSRASLRLLFSMKLPSHTHLPSRLSLPLELESGLPTSLLAICVSSMDVEESQGVAKNNQNSPEGRSQLPS
ncbi:hypothetical protein Bca4012_063513 [Brassica carinata]